MSVRQMTNEAIRNDLKAIALTWPDGVPWQQLDRVNALKGELKRRNEPIEAPAGTAESAAPAGPLEAMSTDALQAELLKLSTRNDEGSQKRFADVRYEIRRRAKQDEPAPTPQVAPRALELPSDDDDDDAAEMKRMVPRRPTPPVVRESVKMKRAPSTVCGFTATGREDGTIVLEYEILSKDGSVIVAKVMDPGDADDFIGMVAAARSRAAKLVSGE